MHGPVYIKQIRNIATLDRFTAQLRFKLLPYPFGKCPLRELNRNLKDFTLFNIDLKHRNCPSASSASVTNNIGRDSGMFNGRAVLLNGVLN